MKIRGDKNISLRIFPKKYIKEKISARVYLN